MKNFTRKASGNEQGSVLLAVLTIMTFASILAATALTFVSTASDRSFDNINDKQSYYTASTCLETFIESVLSPDSTNLNAFIEIANQGGGTSTPIEITGMGSCTISVEKPAGLEYIKVVSTATVNGQENSVACYLRPITEPSETTFKNAVELTGSSSATYNNLFTLGGLAGTNETTKVYATTNDTTINGAFFQYGSIAVLNHINLNSGVRGDGSSITTTKNFYSLTNDVKLTTDVAKKNDSKSNFIFANGAFVQTGNHFYLGTKSTTLIDGVRPNDMDMFAHGMVFGLKYPSNSSTEYSKIIGQELIEDSNNDTVLNGGYYFGDIAEYIQYGNIYCFSGGETNSVDATTGLSNTDGKLAGNMVLDKGRLIVYGDVYVSGDLYISAESTLTIYGNLYVSGEIKGTTTGLTVKAEETTDNLDANVRRTAGTTGFIYCTSFAKANKGKGNDFEKQTSELDNAIYAGFATGRGKEPSNTYEGTKFVFDAEDLLVSDNKNISTISDKYKAICKDKGENIYGLEQYKTTNANKNVGGIDFDYIITGDCYVSEYGKTRLPDNTKKILVDVKSTDIVLVFPDGMSLSDVTILVRNNTKDFENDKSNSPSFCYFTVDTYTDDAKVVINYKTDEEGNYILDSKGEKIVTGSTHSGFVTNAKLSMNNSIIADYETYTNTNLGTGSKALNITHNEIENNEVYNLKNGLGYIVMLLTEGTYVECNNNCLIESTVYGREASMYFANGVNIRCATGVSSEPLIEPYVVTVLGSAVVGGFMNQNTTYVVYYPPSSKSNLANLGSEAASDIVGYEVLKYTQKIG